jgi:hypothetical protein
VERHGFRAVSDGLLCGVVGLLERCAATCPMLRRALVGLPMGCLTFG